MGEKKDLIGTFSVNNKNYEIIECDFGFSQSYSDYTPSGKPMINVINVVIKVSGETNLVDWMVNEKAIEAGSISLKLTEGNYRKVTFVNGFCVAYNERFDNYSSSSMVLSVSILSKDITVEGNGGNEVKYSPLD